MADTPELHKKSDKKTESGIQGADFYNNTIANSLLMPTTDSFVKKHTYTGLEMYWEAYEQDFETHAGSINDDNEELLSNSFSVSVQVGSAKTTLSQVTRVDGLTVTRPVDTRRSGGVGRYAIKLPGPLQYGPVTFSRFQFGNDTFFRWLINGADQGGIQKADFFIRVGNKDNNMTFMLLDAFPIGWELGAILPPDKDGKNLTVMENLTIVYGTLALQRNKPTS